jgi:DNA-binding transcriptional ArsR family regulator
MDAQIRAMADGTRRKILALVWRKELTAGEIAAKFDVTRPAISQHLGVLLASELVTMRRSGTRRLYRANRRALMRLRAELGAFWDDRLARLKDEAEVAERKRRLN